MVEDGGEELTQHADLFAESVNPGRTSLIKHHVNTGNSPPIHQPVRRIPLHK